MQVRNKSSADLLSEISREPTSFPTQLCSYNGLSDLGYDHGIMHNDDFISLTDTSVRTQNTEIHNRLTEKDTSIHTQNTEITIGGQRRPSRATRATMH